MLKELAALAIVALITLGVGTTLFAGPQSAPVTASCQETCI